MNRCFSVAVAHTDAGALTSGAAVVPRNSVTSAPRAATIVKPDAQLGALLDDLDEFTLETDRRRCLGGVTWANIRATDRTTAEERALHRNEDP
jgi:hypothetical protein